METNDNHLHLHLQHGTAKAALVIAKLALGKAKGTSNDDPTNDQKRFKLQDAVGRLNRAEKSVWMKHSHLPK